MPLPLANIFVYFFSLLGATFLETAVQIVCIVGPFAAIAWWLHVLEAIAQSRLAARFGWRAVLWTGWLGTPLHELSHAAACIVFMHRIEEMALFEPDLKAGRLGYVLHAYDPRNPYQVIGNFFIGVAPLVGGTLALVLLLWLLEPETARAAWSGHAIGDALSQGRLFDAVVQLFALSGAVLAALFRWENLASWQLWVFLYLALCVSSHMAPSPQDYAGSWGGGLLLLAAFFVMNLVVLALGATPGWLLSLSAPLTGPALALFGISATLCGVSTALIVLLDWLLARVAVGRA